MPAKACGEKTEMALWLAKYVCTKLIIIPSVF